VQIAFLPRTIDPWGAAEILEFFLNTVFFRVTERLAKI